MLSISYGADNAQLAARLQTDLKTARIRRDKQDSSEQVLIALVSPQSEADEAQQSAWRAAKTNGDFIVPVLTDGAALPQMLAGHKALDFKGGYDFDALAEHLAQLAAREPKFPLKVVTPKKLRSNRRVGLALTVVVFIMFAAAVLGITAGLVGFPKEEYEEVEAEFQATLGVLIDTILPNSTQDAVNFPATVDAAPTRLQPFLAATATALHGGVEVTPEVTITPQGTAQP